MNGTNCTVSFTNNNGDKGDPEYKGFVALYAMNAIHITAAGSVSIEKVVFTYNSPSKNRPRTKDNGDGTFNVNYEITEGQYVESDENQNGVWTGKANTVSLSKKGGKGELDITSVTVYYEIGQATEPVTLHENAVDVIHPAMGATVTLDRAPLVKGEWNTFCVPFDISKEVIEARGNADIRVLTHINGGKFMMARADEIKAGVPCVVKPYGDFGLVFENVNITETMPLTVSKIENAQTYALVGVFDPTQLKTDGSERIIIGQNVLTVPDEDHVLLKGFRAFFRLPDGNAEILVSLDGITTGISELLSDPSTVSDGDRVYNLNGQFVGTSVTGLKKGIYVRHGAKFIVK